MRVYKCITPGTYIVINNRVLIFSELLHNMETISSIYDIDSIYEERLLDKAI